MSHRAPCHLRLTIKGILDESWADYFGSLTIESRADEGREPVTVIAGDLPDQSAFVGVLNSLQVFNMTVLSVNYTVQSV